MLFTSSWFLTFSKQIFVFREQEIYEHLEEYLRRASGLAEKREDLIEVCVLFVQCLEVFRQIILVVILD